MSIQLWPHQSAGARRIKAREISALWWSMRVGKTLTAIEGTSGGDRLIVCPNSCKAVWASDLAAYGEDSYIWNTKPKPKDRPRNVIVNYESLWRSPLLSWNWDSIIFDESQRLSSMNTKLWEHLYSHLPDLCRARVLLLSGTPAPEGWHQTITQSIVATGQWCGFLDPWEALRTAFLYDDEKFKWAIQPDWKKQAKDQLHELGPAMTQAQAGVTTQKLYRMIPVPAGVHEARIWAEAMEDDPTGAQYCLAAQSCASGRSKDGVTDASTKLDAVVEYAVELGEPTVILTRFTSSLNYLVQHLTDKGLRVGAIHGEDGGAEDRAKIVEAFNASRLDVIVANVVTVKVGMNLSHSNTLIFAENSFSGECRIQAEERLTVRGKEAVEIVDFVTVSLKEGLGQVDQGILMAVRAKKDFNAQSLRRSFKSKSKPEG